MDRAKLRYLRRQMIVQKISLQRAYTWLQMPMMGIIFASTIKSAFPSLISGFCRFVILVLFSFVGLIFIGYLDRKFRFLHEEQNYNTETNPLLLDGLKGNIK